MFNSDAYSVSNLINTMRSIVRRAETMRTSARTDAQREYAENYIARVRALGSELEEAVVTGRVLIHLSKYGFESTVLGQEPGAEGEIMIGP